MSLKNYSMLTHSLLMYLNEHTNRLVLTSEAALYFCYHYPKYPSVITLDGYTTTALEHFKNYCAEHNIDDFKVVENELDFVAFDLKVGSKLTIPFEVNLQNKNNYNPDLHSMVNGIQTYYIDELTTQILMEDLNVKTIRELIYIFKNYEDALSPATLDLFRKRLCTRRLKHFKAFLNEEQQKEFLEVYYHFNLI